MVRVYVALLNHHRKRESRLQIRVYSGQETGTHASPRLSTLTQAPSASLITC